VYRDKLKWNITEFQHNIQNISTCRLCRQHHHYLTDILHLQSNMPPAWYKLLSWRTLRWTFRKSQWSTDIWLEKTRVPFVVQLLPSYVNQTCLCGHIVSMTFDVNNDSSKINTEWRKDWVGFNVPLNTLWVISGTGFTGQMTQPTVSKHWRK